MRRWRYKYIARSINWMTTTHKSQCTRDTNKFQNSAAKGKLIYRVYLREWRYDSDSTAATTKTKYKKAQKENANTFCRRRRRRRRQACRLSMRCAQNVVPASHRCTRLCECGVEYARVCVMVNAAKNETNEWKKTAALIRIGRSYVPFQFDLCDLWAQETYSSAHTHAKYSKKSNNMEFTPKWLNHPQVPDTPKIKSTKMHSHTDTENIFHNFRNFVAFVAFNGTQMYDKTNWKRPLCVDFLLILLIFRCRRCWRCASRCVLIGRFSRNCWWRCCCCCHFKASVSQLHGNGIQMNAYFMRLTRTLIDMFAFTLFFLLCFWSSQLRVNVCVGKTCRYWN